MPKRPMVNRWAILANAAACRRREPQLPGQMHIAARLGAMASGCPQPMAMAPVQGVRRMAISRRRLLIMPPKLHAFALRICQGKPISQSASATCVQPATSDPSPGAITRAPGHARLLCMCPGWPLSGAQSPQPTVRCGIIAASLHWPRRAIPLRRGLFQCERVTVCEDGARQALSVQSCQWRRSVFGGGVSPSPARCRSRCRWSRMLP